MCPCGCGQWTDDCLDPSTENRWQVQADRCYARAALAAHAREDDEPSAGQLLSVRLLAGDELAALEFDPDQARAEYEAHQARFVRHLTPPTHQTNGEG